ncbi:3',5'-cyclic AMP phosphodiesterase CpdA [Antricoccus suffuscus]|uniref:3',5'-cyclic AMP phosphodiesterase CpdA n=1 Tax=Antricoccus suffuscus TaxID=1629062 RepID=A0A2T0ZWS9_9ACTN|nr:metallophosphoesterase [Antricoccus suffuscus]PRZ40538.1 3',5'-cyclic AMP phosphodiesterase CpdA [Antricoccus suffuscus]
MTNDVLRILHISDTHLFGDSTLHYGRVDTTGALHRVLKHAADLGPLDLVIVSGDCSDDGTPASYRILAEAVGEYAASHGAQAIYAMGNHDARAGFRAVLGDGHRAAAVYDGVEGPIDGISDVDGVRVITLDSSVPGGKAYGELRDAQITWLTAQLSTPAPRGSIVVLHHPPVPACTPLLRTMELFNPDLLADALDGTDVQLILAGHFHHQFAGSLRGTPVLVAPGVANCTDPTAAPNVQRTLVASGGTLVELAATGFRATSFHVPGTEEDHVLNLLTRKQMAGIARNLGSPDWEQRLAEATGE